MPKRLEQVLKGEFCHIVILDMTSVAKCASARSVLSYFALHNFQRKWPNKVCVRVVISRELSLLGVYIHTSNHFTKHLLKKKGFNPFPSVFSFCTVIRRSMQVDRNVFWMSVCGGGACLWDENSMCCKNIKGLAHVNHLFSLFLFAGLGMYFYPLQGTSEVN